MIVQINDVIYGEEVPAAIKINIVKREMLNLMTVEIHRWLEQGPWSDEQDLDPEAQDMVSTLQMVIRMLEVEARQESARIELN